MDIFDQITSGESKVGLDSSYRGDIFDRMTAGATNRNVPMFAPDGSVREVPSDQVQYGIKNGGEVAHKFKAPDGTMRYVRTREYAQALKNGGIPFNGGFDATSRKGSRLAMMIGSDGTLAQMSAAEADSAIKAGAPLKYALKVEAPDGSQAWVPHDQIAAVLQNRLKIISNSQDNSQPTQFEEDRSNGTGAIATILSNLGRMATSAGPSAFQGSPLHWSPGVNTSAAEAAALAQQEAAGQQDRARAAAGYSVPYRIAAPAMQALVGLNPVAMEEAAAKGNAAGVVGEALTPLAAYGVTRGAGVLVGKAGEMLSSAEKPGSAELITKGVNPPPKNTRWELNLQNNLDLIRETARREGIPVKGREGLLQATQKAAQNRYETYRSILEPVKSEYMDVRSRIPAYKGETTGGESPQARLGWLDQRLDEINNTLEPKYGKGGKAADAAIGAQEASALRTEAAQIRSALYGKLQESAPEGVNVADLKATAGQLNGLADAIGSSIRSDRFRSNQTLKQNPPHSFSELAMRGYSNLADRVLGNPADQAVARGFNRSVPDRSQYVGSITKAITEGRRAPRGASPLADALTKKRGQSQGESRR